MKAPVAITASAGRRYAVTSLVVASIALVAVLPPVVAYWPGRVGWALLGWALMTVVGVGGGAWTAAAYGRPGTDFLKATVTCILSRLAGAAAGALLAGQQGMGAVWPYLAGLGAGFVSLQLFEIGWFLRQPRAMTLPRGSDAVGH